MKLFTLALLLLCIQSKAQFSPINAVDTPYLRTYDTSRIIPLDVCLHILPPELDTIQHIDTIYPAWASFVLQDGSIRTVAAKKLIHKYRELRDRHCLWLVSHQSIEMGWRVIGVEADIIPYIVALQSYGDSYGLHNVGFWLKSQPAIRLGNISLK